MDTYTLAHKEQLKIAAFKELTNSHFALTNKMIQNSKFHPLYKTLKNVQDKAPQHYMMDPTPYIYKSFLCQLRIHPYCIQMKQGILIIDRISKCHLCDGNILIWYHTVHQCPQIKMLNLSIPQGFYKIKNDSDLFTKVLLNPYQPYIWYLFKIVKSSIQLNI